MSNPDFPKYQISLVDGQRLRLDSEIDFVERSGGPVEHGLIHFHYDRPPVDWERTSTDPKVGYASVSVERPNGMSTDHVEFPLDHLQFERLLKNPDGAAFKLH
jgi:hypothetical protein